ncbi:hypothetical protein [Nocardia otitidiscaviarum]|uniref:hypothetical protein n=1 Tax=Nocardia otitidiscaviarum TaxID=1823 RepID=UPI0011C07B67|nr:hypothetical protein [Nocardia otitidiscaviarum]
MKIGCLTELLGDNPLLAVQISALAERDPAGYVLANREEPTGGFGGEFGRVEVGHGPAISTG